MKMPDATPRISLDDLRAALDLQDFEAQEAQARMSPHPRTPFPENNGSTPRRAGVLVLVYPEPDSLHLVLTRRTDHLRGHSGQISFPGGGQEAVDESLAATALRETCEELGLCDEDIRLIGELSPVYIPPSHYDVHPVVGMMDSRPLFYPSPDEVAEVFSLSLHILLDDRVKQWEYRHFRGQQIQIPYYAVNGHKVWGATGAMLSELEWRLRAVVPARTIPGN
jgi:8-oxo-dGTP pyrophosphatase MutT (NUDIX family)